MIIDKELELSADQALSALTGVASTNYINLGAAGKDIGPGEPIPLLVQVTEAFDALTSLTVTVQKDDNTSFSSATDVVAATVLLADLIVGKKFPILNVPRDMDEQYARLYYQVNGSVCTVGKLEAVVVTLDQTNKANL